uniref:Integrase core domain containing protein n=1 Tax=Solanum tuberosum TaxID=4113 RepID=M1DH45_SOLTU
MKNLQKNGLVQRSTDPIDGPSIHPWTVDGVHRSQTRILLKNGLRCGLENKEWLKPGTGHIHDAPSMDRRLGTLDRGLIQDEANVGAPRIEPQVEVPPLGADLADTVGQAQGVDLIIPDHTDTIPTSFSQAASRAPSSSRSTPPLGVVVVPLARVQKLEAQMATLLHHIQPWMQKSIAKFEARKERRMEGMMDRKIQAVNNRLDAFELKVLELPAPAINLSSFEAELASLRADVDAILTTPTVEPQAAPTTLADNTVLDALFNGTAEEGLEPTHTKGKRHRSSRTDEEKAQKRQRRQEKEARKASILDEELRQ